MGLEGPILVNFDWEKGHVYTLPIIHILLHSTGSRTKGNPSSFTYAISPAFTTSKLGRYNRSHHIEWNLRAKDTLGPTIASVHCRERLSSSRRFQNAMEVATFGL